MALIFQMMCYHGFSFIQFVKLPAGRQALYFLIHSVRSDFTGLAMAALIAWKLIVTNAINKADAPASINIHQPMFTLNAKSRNHVFIAHHANGKATILESKMSLRKLFDNNRTIPDTEAPKTFLTPISFVRWIVANMVSPNKPRQATKMAMPA